MKIVNITGGLGNQMFQYAFALALKQAHPNEMVFVDIQHYHSVFFKKFRGANLHNGYEINTIFPNAYLPIARFSQIIKLSYWIPNYIISRLVRKYFPVRKTEYIAKRNDNYTFDEFALNNRNNCYYEGYWESIKYYQNIKRELIKVFSHPTPNLYNAKIIEDMEKLNSVGIHIRRGDYLNMPEFKGICTIDYYNKAISEILTDGLQHVFYVFSNDISWCKENILPLLQGHRCVFVTENTGKNSCWDMFLMTHCKDLIIANSSFSWWGAFLNKRINRVYAPYPWVHRNCNMDIYDKSWIKLI